jgi:hypothetical protein
MTTLVFFDFDETMTKEHIYNLIRNNLILEEKITEQSPELGLPKTKFFKEVSEMKNVKLIVISYGIVSEINNIMKKAGWFKYFSNVIARNSDEDILFSKGDTIAKWIEYYNGEKVLYLDDSIYNIKEANKVVPHIYTRLVCGGMNNDDMNWVKNMI